MGMEQTDSLWLNGLLHFFVLMLSVYLFIELNYYLRFNQCLNRPYI